MKSRNMTHSLEKTLLSCKIDSTSNGHTNVLAAFLSAVCYEFQFEEGLLGS